MPIHSRGTDRSFEVVKQDVEEDGTEKASAIKEQD